jgi:hypothetical protein
MLSARCAVLTVAALLSAGFAAASPLPVRPAVDLIAPAVGQPLRAGSVAELAWEPRDLFGGLGRVDEWEAFLSLDGGAHYTVRITPHLDRGLRRVLWQVPAVPSADARLLLRFGDERREAVFEVPERFVITGPVAPTWPGNAAGFESAPVRRAFQRGEPALPGQPGVVAWAEGTRRGGSARMVVGSEPPSAQSREPLIERADETVLLAAARGPELDPAVATVPAGRVIPSSRRHTSSLLLRDDPAAPIPILLQGRRRNE